MVKSVLKVGVMGSFPGAHDTGAHYPCFYEKCEFFNAHSRSIPV